MSRRFSNSVALLLTVLTAFTGCHPTQPFYLHEDGDLSHYIDQATDLEYPDVEAAGLEEASCSQPPITLSDPDVAEYWELSLEEAVSIALHNSKVIRNLGSVTPFGFADALTGRTAASATVYDPAISETDVEGALASFDAQLSLTGTGTGGQTGFLSRTDRPQNVIPENFLYPQTLLQDLGGLRVDLSKRTAGGTRLTFSHQTDYDRGNSRGSFQALNSYWTTAFEVRADQPVLRGRGAQVNRIRGPDGSPGVMLARINTDVTLANFEAAVRNLVLDIENTYWDLYCAYRALETAEIGRDSALSSWQKTAALVAGEMVPAMPEAQAREQYFFFRSTVETAFRDVVNTENRLRWLMGLAASDGRLIRPSNEPTQARVDFEWRDIQTEALARSAELRQQRWVVKRNELELIYARNQVLPQLDVGALYRWLGVGDQLVSADRNGLDFPAEGSTAWESLTDGKYQEFAFFFNFQMPVGVRGALAGVRRAQLALAQSKARLEDMELNTSHLLTTAVRNLDSHYLLAQTHFNRLIAAKDRVDRLEVLKGVKHLGGGDLAVFWDLLLGAYRVRAQAQFDYYRALCDYSKSIAEVHYRKGSLLEYNNVYLAEGPWADKAYWDALQRARQRDASYYFNYGWTRPRVVSRGPVQQHVGDSLEAVEGEAIPFEVAPTPAPPAEPIEVVPTPAPQSAPPAEPIPKPQQPAPPGQAPVPSQPTGPALKAPTVRKPSPGGLDKVAAQRPAGAFPWGSLKLRPNTSAPVNALRLASHEEELSNSLRNQSNRAPAASGP
jgi:outer membrane protein TolC